MTFASDGPACPTPIERYPLITMAHGAGGRLMNQLIDTMFAAAFENRFIRQRHDGAVVPAVARPLALSTDSFVVRPLEFPGGSIGELAIHGTANDLAMCGARPRYLTLGLILEEGLPVPTLWREVLAMKRACAEVNLAIVAGDTKVVERGKGDGMYVNTAGVGEVVSPAVIAPSAVEVGDAILVSGDLGRHGTAVLGAREGLSFEGTLESDCGSLVAPALALLEGGIEVHCLRDLTRGGLASALHEVAASAGLSMRLSERQLRVSAAVQSACELFGLDPLYVANEGRFAAWVAADHAERAVEILRAFEISRDAAVAGSVVPAERSPRVTVQNDYGARRVLDLLSGEQLPRIC